MFLLWVRTFSGTLTPQVAFDAHGGRPFLDGAIRARVASWLPISADEAALPLVELAYRHPPRMGRIRLDAAQPPVRLRA